MRNSVLIFLENRKPERKFTRYVPRSLRINLPDNENVMRLNILMTGSKLHICRTQNDGD